MHARRYIPRVIMAILEQESAMAAGGEECGKSSTASGQGSARISEGRLSKDKRQAGTFLGEMRV